MVNFLPRYRKWTWSSSTWAWAQSQVCTTCCHGQWWGWRRCGWSNHGSSCWVGKNCWWVINNVRLYESWHTCSSMSWPWHIVQRHWGTKFSLSPTALYSRSTQIRVRHLSILLYTWQNIHVVICSHYLLCTQWLMWVRWHAPWAYPCCYFLEMGQTLIWLCFHQLWWTWARYPWIEHRSSQTFLFCHCESCQVPLCTCQWVFTRWEHGHVGRRVQYFGWWKASDSGGSLGYYSVLSSLITYS